MALASQAVDCAATMLALPVASYIARQRDRLTGDASALTEHSKDLLRPYFSPIDLERVRIVQADPLPIRNPPLYQLLRRLQLDFPEPRLAAAITLDNVIASRDAMDPELLFHELVHVVQFRVLGLHRFARLYAKGFLMGASYERIPLEVCAFDLQRQFASQHRPFNVADEVCEWFRLGLF